MSVASVATVHRSANSETATMQLGEHTFGLVDGTEQTHPVIVVAGWPGIVVPTVEGKKLAALEPVQVKKTLNKKGTWRWRQFWLERDMPEFNCRVSTVGDRSLRVWLLIYQSRVNRNALIAWHYLTGGDSSEWFGDGDHRHL